MTMRLVCLSSTKARQAARPVCLERIVSAHLLTAFTIIALKTVPGIAEDQIRLQPRTVFPEAQLAGMPLKHPQAIEVDDAGNLYVVDTGNNRVLKLAGDGVVQAVVGGFGWQKEAFDRPMDASMKTGLDLYIADHNNERIERYDRRLNYISSYESDESLPEGLRFGLPVSVAASRHGELFICEIDHNRILKLDAFGQPVLSFGDFNAGEGQLLHPARVAVSRDDLIYVSDHGRDQIIVFDYYGNFVTRFGEKQFNDPSGMTWFGRDYLFVADSGNGRVTIFDRSLAAIASWGGKDDQFAAFRLPVDVAVWKDTLFVLDSESAQIHVFDITMKPVR